jgi:hypothetical protein
VASDNASPVDTSSIVFDVTSSSGNPNLLVGCQISPTGDSAGYPSAVRGHFNFSSGYYGEDSIVVTSGDHRRCVGGVYYVAVYAREACVFSLTASHMGGIVTLQNGVTVQGTVYARVNLEYRYRIYLFPSFLDLILAHSYVTADSTWGGRSSSSQSPSSLSQVGPC